MPRLNFNAGAGVIIGGLPYVRTGKVLGTPVGPFPSSGDTLYLGAFNYSIADDNGLADYSVAQRTISKMPVHSGTGGSGNPGSDSNGQNNNPGSFFTAPSSGVIRYMSTWGQGGDSAWIWVNGIYIRKDGLPYQESASLYYHLAAGNTFGAWVGVTSLFYTFLPDTYP